jgi:hypothetical protein
MEVEFVRRKLENYLQRKKLEAGREIPKQNQGRVHSSLCRCPKHSSGNASEGQGLRLECGGSVGRGGECRCVRELIRKLCVIYWCWCRLHRGYGRC